MLTGVATSMGFTNNSGVLNNMGTLNCLSSCVMTYLGVAKDFGINKLFCCCQIDGYSELNAFHKLYGCEMYGFRELLAFTNFSHNV